MKFSKAEKIKLEKLLSCIDSLDPEIQECASWLRNELNKTRGRPISNSLERGRLALLRYENGDGTQAQIFEAIAQASDKSPETIRKDYLAFKALRAKVDATLQLMKQRDRKINAMVQNMEEGDQQIHAMIQSMEQLYRMIDNAISRKGES